MYYTYGVNLLLNLPHSEVFIYVLIEAAAAAATTIMMMLMLLRKTSCIVRDYMCKSIHYIIFPHLPAIYMYVDRDIIFIFSERRRLVFENKGFARNNKAGARSRSSVKISTFPPSQPCLNLVSTYLHGDCGICMLNAITNADREPVQVLRFPVQGVAQLQDARLPVQFELVLLAVVRRFIVASVRCLIAGRQQGER